MSSGFAIPSDMVMALGPLWWCASEVVCILQAGATSDRYCSPPGLCMQGNGMSLLTWSDLQSCDKPCLKAKGLFFVCVYVLCVYVNDSHVSAICQDHPHLQQYLSADAALVYHLWSFLTWRPQVLLLLRCRPKGDTQRHGCNTFICSPARTLLGWAFGTCQFPRTTFPSGASRAFSVPSPPPPPPAPAPSPPHEQRTQRSSRKDTVLAQKPGMPCMVALLQAK